MSEHSSYSVARFSLLRTAILPQRSAIDTLTDLDPTDPDQAEAVREHVLGLVADPLVREAVEVSSSSLARTLDLVANGGSLSGAKLRRLLLAVTSYRLRMATRATPFGLMAGVAAADSGEHATKVRLGTAHRKRVNVDHGWLSILLSRWEQDPVVLARVRVVTNDLVVRRGDRLVVPYAPATGEDPVARPDEVSVRITALVELVIERAARPVPFAELVDEISKALPIPATERVQVLITSLIGRRVLLTDLRPPSGAADSLDHVRNALRGTGDLPELAQLHTVHERVTAYENEPLGNGTLVLREAVAALNALHTKDAQLHVDLAVDADVRLPSHVGEEAARAATVLWRLNPLTSRSTHLTDYHAEFLDRYGTGRLVPVMELLYSARGLGAPASYLVPTARRTYRTNPASDGAELLDLAYQAGWDHRREVVLDDDLLAHLASEPETAPSDPLDFCATVLASSTDALDARDFRLVTTPFVGSSGGTYAARFGHLLPDIAAQLPPAPGAELPVHVVFEAKNARLANVAGVPDGPEHRINIGRFADPEDEHELALGDIAVFATSEGLHLYSRSLERILRPTARNMVNMTSQAPNIARFLVEAPTTGHRLWSGWQWGPAAELPYLPRVRSGHTVLTSARWRPPGELCSADMTWRTWRDKFRSWCEQWEIPSQIQVIRLDRRLELDLSCDVHLHLLRQELRKPGASLVELPCGGEYGVGWADGRTNEIVFALRPTSSAERVQPRPVTSARTSSRVYAPGGQWLYARIYTATNHQDTVLARRLPELLEALPDSVDRWFFIRYRDPEPHLRLRWHGDPGDLRREVLPMLHDWAADLRARGEADRLELGTYDPELERYGGPALIDAAEQAFHADSIAVLAQLGRKATHSGELLAAINYADILRALDESGWMTWLAEKHPRLERRPAFQRLRTEAVRTVDLTGDRTRLREIDPVVAGALENRWPTIHRYGELCRSERSWSTLDTVLSSLLHMHFNRLVGVDRETELDSIAITAGVTRLHLSRLRVLSS